MGSSITAVMSRARRFFNFSWFVLRDPESWRWCNLASFLADRDQQANMTEALVEEEIVHRNIGWQPGADNLSTIIDALRRNQSQSRIGRNHRAQANHGAAVVPHTRAKLAPIQTELRR